nr:protein kinase [Streptomyces triticagri]
MDRRGSTVWDVTTADGRYAVKAGYPIEATEHWSAQPWTAHAPGREAAVLAAMNTPVTTGTWASGTWNAQPWHEGPDLQQLWERYRLPGSAEPIRMDAALECARALADLHARGWAHGDVQPAHFILGLDKTHLIDLALTAGPDVPADVDFPYRGCLVHYEAPEISRSVLETGTAMPTQAADVYALGASLLMAARGRRYVVYPDDASRADQRTEVVHGVRRSINVEGPLHPLLTAMLAYTPRGRPTITEVVEELTGAHAGQSRSAARGMFPGSV